MISRTPVHGILFSATGSMCSTHLLHTLDPRMGKRSLAGSEAIKPQCHPLPYYNDSQTERRSRAAVWTFRQN
ncbi:uncharacterized protein BDV17DRAFT_262024 [Aspergillus undulatus]|uniref:uncharacterized protein n=1 Tax=Aspergillus undulatus TaxID=1810928 RepID=UPI003CCE1CB6